MIDNDWLIDYLIGLIKTMINKNEKEIIQFKEVIKKLEENKKGN